MGNSQSCNQQQCQQTSCQEPGSKEEFEEFEITPCVVVTGFGTLDPGKSDESNLSWRVVEKLSGNIDYKGDQIPIIKGKLKQDKSGPEPVKVCYSYIEDTSDNSFKQWLYGKDALVYLHLGVDTDTAGQVNNIRLETTARRDVEFIPDNYHHNDTPLPMSELGHLYPDLDSSEIEKHYNTSFSVSTLCENLTKQFKSEIPLKDCSANSTKSIKFYFIESKCAGYSLCDFLYYVSLDLAAKRNNARNVLFIHIPEDLVLRQGDNTVTCTRKGRYVKLVIQQRQKRSLRSLNSLLKSFWHRLMQLKIVQLLSWNNDMELL